MKSCCAALFLLFVIVIGKEGGCVRVAWFTCGHTTTATT